MVTMYATVDTEIGRIQTVGVASTREEALASSFEDLTTVLDPPVDAHPNTHWYNVDQFEERPAIPEPSANYDLTQLPPGTVVHVSNEAGDKLTITDLSEPLVLTDPGVYRLSVDPPFPYTPIRTFIEVT